MSMISHFVPMLATLAVPTVLVSGWLGDARESLAGHAQGAASQQAVTASVAEEGYCTAELKQIVRRVAGACGLLGAEGRGCRPADASKVVALSGDDFNKLFMPLRERVRIIQYDQGKSELDVSGQRSVEEAWGDRGGASFFFVVARASPEGSVEANRALSELRAKEVLTHLTARFQDPDIERQVGLLWLGEEFAQLNTDFCEWHRSREAEMCTEKDINRSAFIAWIDCAI